LYVPCFCFFAGRVSELLSPRRTRARKTATTLFDALKVLSVDVILCTTMFEAKRGTRNEDDHLGAREVATGWV